MRYVWIALALTIAASFLPGQPISADEPTPPASIQADEALQLRPALRVDPPASTPAPAQTPPGRPGDRGMPVEAIAKELGVTPEQFREAYKKVASAAHGKLPTEAQRKRNRQVLSESLGMDLERINAVMDKYKPKSPTAPPGHRLRQD